MGIPFGCNIFAFFFHFFLFDCFFLCFLNLKVYSITINKLELAKNCYTLFRRQLPLLHSVLEHLFDPNDKHVNPFFQWKTVQM